MSFSKRSWAAILLGFLTLFVVSCGDSSDVNDISGQQGNPGGQNPIFPGRYLGAANINAQLSILDLTVANSGQATGTLTVSTPAQAVNISNGVYNVTGSVNLSAGTFSLTGNFPGVGAFTIVGTLPAGNNLGNYVLTINGQTFNGNIQSANLGTPNPPAGGGGDGDERLILGGELSNFTFTPDGDYNGVNPPVDDGSLITGAVVTGSATENLVTISISETAGAEVRALVFGVVTHDGEELEVGQTYPLVASEDADGSLLSLSESTGTTVNAAWISTSGTSTGSVTIVALDDNGVELDFNFSNVVPNSGVNGNTAEGSFSTSGTVVADFATLP